VLGHDGELIEDEVVVRRDGRHEEGRRRVVEWVEWCMVGRRGVRLGGSGLIGEGGREAELKLGVEGLALGHSMVSGGKQGSTYGDGVDVEDGHFCGIVR